MLKNSRSMGVVRMIGLIGLLGCGPALVKGAGPGAGNGLWEGSFDINGAGPYSFTGLFIGGEIAAVSLDAKVVYEGEFATREDRYSSALQLFQLDGGPFDFATLQGMITGEGSIQSQYKTKRGGDSGSLRLEYNPLYERGSSLRLIQGKWRADEEGIELDMEIDNEGTLSGSDDEGCQYQGQLLPVDTDYNAYRVSIEVTACGAVDGGYEGYAYVDAEKAGEAGINIMITSPHYGLYLPLTRRAKAGA